MPPIIQISKLCKRYKCGLLALQDVSLDIFEGEILALLGPNGAGKTTMISMICGLTTITSGSVTVGGFNIQSQTRGARQLIGLVPQELTLNIFESVWDTLAFSRGLFGLSPNEAYLEKLLKTLSLWDKRHDSLNTLSGGMKRRVMIAKALAHEPKVLFLDEPTAGVDVELRKDMWEQIRSLRSSGVTIILTTHYIDEAEEMADRIGIINKGKIILIEEKSKLIETLGKKYMVFELSSPVSSIPTSLSDFELKLDGMSLRYEYIARQNNSHISDLFDALKSENIRYTDIRTNQKSLEEIFVELVSES